MPANWQEDPDNIFETFFSESLSNTSVDNPNYLMQYPAQRLSVFEIICFTVTAISAELIRPELRITLVQLISAKQCIAKLNDLNVRECVEGTRRVPSLLVSRPKRRESEAESPVRLIPFSILELSGVIAQALYL
jgi:hypothetical protein